MAEAGRIRELVTPEGVDLRVRLGDVAERGAALVLDLLIMVVTLVVLTVGSCTAMMAAGAAKNEASAEVVAVVWLLIFFAMRQAYFILFELGPRAATPGKRMLGLRVAARNGGRLTADMVFARNFMRELELFLPMVFVFSGGQGVDAWIRLMGLVWSGVFLLFPLFNRDRLRVGDMIAGTWVVKAPRRKLMADLAGEAEIRAADFRFTTAQTDAYGVHELHVLEVVLRTRDRKTMAAVATRIRVKIGWSAGEGEHDADFLSAYYAALRSRLETRLLFGKRKKDKFDV